MELPWWLVPAILVLGFGLVVWEIGAISHNLARTADIDYARYAALAANLEDRLKAIKIVARETERHAGALREHFLPTHADRSGRGEGDDEDLE